MKKISKTKLFAGVILLLFLLLLIIFVYIMLTLPQLPADISQLSLTAGTAFYAGNGELISQLGDRRLIQISQISGYFRKAIVAVEDASFFRHHGLSKLGLLRALLRDIQHMRIVEGGSSITQQLAKNLFLTFDQTFGRKFKEMFLAMQLEAQFSKEEILQAYCNQICFGPGIYGVEMAAQSYLGKHADELSLAEAAFLANLPRSPANYNPTKNFELAKRRQGIVLRRMVKVNFISQEEMQQALEEPLHVRPLNSNYGQANYFLSYVRASVEKQVGRDLVNYGGLKIYTTLDNELQALANKAVQDGLARFDKRLGLPEYKNASRKERVNYPQAALVAIEPKTGKIKALVGGRDFKTSEFNRAIQHNRLPGSSFKPIVYLTALDQGNYHPATVINDHRVTFGKGRDAYSPRNFGNKYYGPVILKKAIMNSLNSVAAQTLKDIGPGKVVENAHRFGISSEIKPDLSLALGSYGVSPLEMAGAYSVFANEGIFFHPRIVKHVEGSNGDILARYPLKSKRVCDPQSIYLLVDMMKAVLESGTAKHAKYLGFKRRAAGKTGTTNNYRDAWFIGFTPQLVTAVWVGYDDNRPMYDARKRGITGGSGALPIWVAFMKQALQGKLDVDFPIPAGIIFENVNPATGKIVPPDEPESMRVAIRFNTPLE